MNWNVHPGSRISHLPKPLRGPAILARNFVGLFRSPVQRFKYAADGVGTNHYCPFKDDVVFEQLYQKMVANWFEVPMDVRWRMWIMVQLSKQSAALGGSYAEFGVFRAGCAFMILNYLPENQNIRFHLFDTFSGVPSSGLTKSESEFGMAGTFSNTSRSYVESYLATWKSCISLVEGDVCETLRQYETGPLAFCHMDLNASVPTKVALDYSYSRLVPGGVILLDDYGWDGYEDQRAVIDTFFSDKPESVIALPTGQGIVVKL